MKESPETNIPERLVQEISRVGNVVLFTHVHPDGDAFGSLFGLAGILESCGKKVHCFLEEPVCYSYSFLPGNGKAYTDIGSLWRFVEEAGGDIAAIALDCGDEERLGRFKRDLLKIKPFLVIDHHQSHTGFGSARWVEPTRSSTGEMVYELALRLGVDIDYNSALNLYVAICTDTGSFRYECTRARTMQIAAELLEKGVRPEKVASYLYDNFSPERLKLMELVLSTITLRHGGRVAFIHVSKSMLEESGASLEDVEGFIDFPRSLQSVKVAVFLKENDEELIGVSMRAKGECNVADIARRFDGGGHRNAAGFRCLGKTLQEVRDELGEVLGAALNEKTTAAAG
ncbi:MAG: DHH family phosphoesterase [Desulforhopalus sp.]